MKNWKFLVWSERGRVFRNSGTRSLRSRLSGMFPRGYLSGGLGESARRY